jgi:hypothetical protein
LGGACVREWTGRGVSGALLYRVLSVAASAVVVWNPGARSSRSCKRPAYIKELRGCGLDSCNWMMGCTTGHRWDRKSECVNRSMGTTLPPSQRLGGGRSSGASGAQCRNRYVFTFSQNAGWVGPQTEYMTHKHITDGHSLLFFCSPSAIQPLSFHLQHFHHPHSCCCLLRHPRTAVICSRRVVFREGKESPLQSVWDLGPPPDRYQP